MRDQRGSLDERAFSVLFVFHFVADLAFAQPILDWTKPSPLFIAGRAKIPRCQSTSDEKVKPRNYESGGHDESS
jgi:hypothetical protein